ncbi:MAG: hypothetical protein RL609_943 [Bacteroidota bacterium]|jgi:glycosyltransferase involved in cell wall biosynthesis
MSDSPRILIFSDWFSPGFKAGGPIRSVSNLVQLLGKRAWVITSDRDLGDDVPYTGIPRNQWVEQPNGAHVMYCADDATGITVMKKVCRDFIQDAWFMNSMFSVTFTLKPMLWNRQMAGKNKLILAPRGMLHPEALRIKSLKKQLFLKSMKWLGFFKRVVWQPTSEEEAHHIKKYFGNHCPVLLMPNIPTFHPFRAQWPKWENKKWVMISRLSPEKGVLEGLQAWYDIPQLKSIELRIIGPQGDQGYSQRILQLIHDHADWNVQYAGPMSPEMCCKALQSAHYLYSPTRGENYGHAIAESLLMGVPVVVANTTPWKNLVEKGWGWDFALSDASFKKVMMDVLSADESSYADKVQHLLQFRNQEEARWRTDVLDRQLFDEV